MNNEQKLLVALIGDASEMEITSLTKQNIDWALFLETAKNHRIIPLIYKSLSRFPVNLPAKISDELQANAEKQALKNLDFFVELSRLAEIFEKSEIEFIAYKGLTLAQLAYGDPSLRRFGDLDIFVRKSDFPRANRTILENGGTSRWDLTESQERAVRKYYYEYPFWFGRTRVLVEVHWAFMENFFGFDYEKADVFGRSQTIVVHGKEFRTLSNEDLLIILCAHGSKHYWTRLSWICDVGKLINSQSIDWELAARLARKFGSMRMLALGLFLVEEVLEIELSDYIRRYIPIDKTVRLIAENLQDQIFANGTPDESIRIKLHLKMRERWRDKLSYSQRLFRTKIIDSLFMPMGRPT